MTTNSTFYKEEDTMMRLFVVLAVIVGASCARTIIESPEERNRYGNFSSRTNLLPIPSFENPGDEWKKFSEGIEMQDRGRADAQYTHLLQREALGFSQQAMDACENARKFIARCAKHTSDPKVKAACEAGAAEAVQTARACGMIP